MKYLLQIAYVNDYNICIVVDISSFLDEQKSAAQGKNQKPSQEHIQL